MKEQTPPAQLADGQAGQEGALYESLAHIQLPHTIAERIHCVWGAVCDMLFDIYLAHRPAYVHPYQLLQSQKINNTQSKFIQWYTVIKYKIWTSYIQTSQALMITDFWKLTLWSLVQWSQPTRHTHCL